MNGVLNDDIVYLLFLWIICIDRIPFLDSNDDLERMANGDVPLLVHTCRTQHAIGVGNLDVEPERPRSGTHPLRCQLRSALLFALSGILEIFVDERIERRLPRVFFSEREYGSVTSIRIFQATEGPSSRTWGLGDPLHLSVVCHFLY